MDNRSSTLPPEILSYIFRLAAGEPSHTFDTSPLPPLSEERRSWTPRSEDDEYGERAQTRTSLVRVSKFWRSVALELLYESVTVKRPLSTLPDPSFSHSMRLNPVSSFLNALYRDQSATKLHNATYDDPQQQVTPATHFIRRLDIHPISYWDRSFISDHNALQFSGKFHNLSILIMTNAVEPPAGFIAQIVLKSGCPLRHFETHCRKSWSAEIIRKVASTLEFVSFNCKDQSYSYSDSDMVLPFTLPHVHTVEISDIDEEDFSIILWFKKCHFPSLQRLFFQPNRWMNPDTNAIRSLYHVVGRTVTILDVRTIGDTGYYSGFAIILRSFPLLQELTIHCTAISVMDLDDTGLFRPHSSLILLNLVSDRPRGPPDGIGDFSPIFDRVQPNLDLLLNRFIKPMLVQGKLSLRHVRLLGVKPAEFSTCALHREKANIWRGYIDQYGAAQVRLELSGGDLVSV
jgi:hypothetical protein